MHPSVFYDHFKPAAPFFDVPPIYRACSLNFALGWLCQYASYPFFRYFRVPAPAGMIIPRESQFAVRLQAEFPSLLKYQSRVRYRSANMRSRATSASRRMSSGTVISFLTRPSSSSSITHST